MSNINYTIAVMIYNVESFLGDCIESCIKNPGGDIEILLIDDGSTDGSGKICDEYAKQDCRIRVIHKKNSGVSSARNAAINHANGKWLIMVDGDDVLTDNAIESGRRYVNDDSDLLQFDAMPFTDVLKTDEWTPKGKEMLVVGDELKKYHLQLIDRTNVKIKFPTFNMNPAWGKMWNMGFIKRYNLRYDEKVHKGEGTLFTFTASYVMKKIRFIPQIFYGYRINPTSIMHRFSEDILENQNVQYIQYYKVVEEHGELDNEDIANALYRRGLYLIENAIRLSIAHPDCTWKRRQKIAWADRLCALPWVNQSVKYAECTNQVTKINKYILNDNVSSLVTYCNLLRIRQMYGQKIKKIVGNSMIKMYRKIRYGN